MRQLNTSIKIGEKLESILGQDYIESIAREENFVQRSRSLGGAAFLGTNISCVGSTGFCSLTEQTVKLLKDYNICITKKGLNDRFNNFGVNFMKRIFKEILELSLSNHLEIDNYRSFTGIYLKDATGKQLPECYVELFKGSGGSSSKAGLKVDFAYNILSDEMEMSLRDGASNDANSPLNTYKRDSIYIWDLGYFNTESFEQVKLSDAFFYKPLQNKDEFISRC